MALMRFDPFHELGRWTERALAGARTTRTMRLETEAPGGAETRASSPSDQPGFCPGGCRRHRREPVVNISAPGRTPRKVAR